MKYLLTNDWKFQQLIEYAVCFKFVKNAGTFKYEYSFIFAKNLLATRQYVRKNS